MIARSASLAPRAATLAVGALALCAGGGCAEPDAAQAAWSLRLSDPSLAPRVVVMEATVLAGGCDGVEIVYRAEIAADMRGPTPPALAPGRYGLSARARDAQCRTIAEGCLDVTLPSPLHAATFEVLLDPVDAGPACSDNACRAGRCESTAMAEAAMPTPRDGSAPEPEPPDAAGTDAARLDAARPDAGRPMVPEQDGGLDARAAPDAAATTDAAATPDSGPPPPPPPPPPDPCTLDRCYDVVGVGQELADARAACWALGGELASLADPVEEAFVVGLAAGLDSFWIGFALNVDGRWGWLDGTSNVWTNWAPGEPGAPREDFGCAAYHADRGQWTAQRCRNRRAFVCERAR